MKAALSSLALIAVLTGCASLGPSSHAYKPLPWEAPFQRDYSKYPFPNEISADHDLGKRIHWLGIIDSFWIDGDDSSSTLHIAAQHKFWDYIEDISIQREVMFVSPLGAGAFVYTKVLNTKPDDSTIAALSDLAHKNNIGMFYGEYSGSINGVPVLEGDRVRFIHRQFYSTRILSYEIKRDSTGEYNMADVTILKVAGPGINDPEDTEFE